MNGIEALQTELGRWEEDLAALEYECTADGWSQPEKLLFTLQRTAIIYRQRVLPRIMADRAVVLPAIPHSEAPAALASYSKIIGEELVRLVGTLEETRTDLIRLGQTTELQLQANSLLAAIRALRTVILRFDQEVELPSLNARFSPEQFDQLISAVHAYEKDLR